jgi:two-component system, cell cycle sensor histidine kinase and response regulator CckA
VTARPPHTDQDLAERLTLAEATIAALLSGQIDAVVDPTSHTPVLLATAQRALRESEERYRRIVETTNQGVWLIDAEYRTTFMNRRMAEMLRCEADMGLGRSLFEFLDDEGRAVFTSNVRVGKQVEVQYRRTDDSRFWALVEATAIFDRDGKCEGSFAMVSDISERKKTEAALLASEARFRGLWDSGIILVAIADGAGAIIEINDAGLAMLGHSRSELSLGQIRWDEITPSDWRDEKRVAPGQLRLAGAHFSWEKELTRRNGASVSLLVAAARLDSSERIAIAVDVTGRKVAEKDLLERMRIAALTAEVGMALTQEPSLSSALGKCSAAIVEKLNVAFAGIWTHDPENDLLELQASSGFAVAPGGPFDRVPVGHLNIGRVASDMRPYLTNELGREGAGNGPPIAGISAFAGHPLLVNDQLMGVVAILSSGPISQPAFTGLGTISAALAVGIQRKQVTTANASLESQLRQSQKMEAVGRLAGGIAHDFNNILSVILTCGEFLLEDMKAVDPGRADVEDICKAATRAAALTRQLLMFSRQQVLDPRVLDLAAVADSMESMLRRVLGEDIELVLGSDAPKGRVRADPGSIEQVLMNLVVNARDAMPTGGKLSIWTRNEILGESFSPSEGQIGATRGRHVVLSVTDTGTGMDAATQARIFEPFFTTKEVGKGTGLGLSTVFGIVQQSGGQIRVRSEPGNGTTFSIYLPQVDEVADAPATRPKAALDGSETIMLVEDEEQVRAVARNVLQRHGYHVIEMRSGQDALAYCQSHPAPIDLLLTDVVMPQMSGPELAHQLSSVRPALAVLCMSGYTDDSIVRHGFLQADLAFLHKPFTAESLTRRVREVLDARPAI